jgi:hypothetical protein
MTDSLVEKRDGLIKELQGKPGFVSVGFTKRDGKIALLVAVNDSFYGDVPETFEGMEVVVRDLGEAHVAYSAVMPS